MPAYVLVAIKAKQMSIACCRTKQRVAEQQQACLSFHHFTRRDVNNKLEFEHIQEKEDVEKSIESQPSFTIYYTVTWLARYNQRFDCSVCRPGRTARPMDASSTAP